MERINYTATFKPKDRAMYVRKIDRPPVFRYVDTVIERHARISYGFLQRGCAC